MAKNPFEGGPKGGAKDESKGKSKEPKPDKRASHEKPGIQAELDAILLASRASKPETPKAPTPPTEPSAPKAPEPVAQPMAAESATAPAKAVRTRAEKSVPPTREAKPVASKEHGEVSATVSNAELDSIEARLSTLGIDNPELPELRAQLQDLRLIEPATKPGGDRNVYLRGKHNGFTAKGVRVVFEERKKALAESLAALESNRIEIADESAKVSQPASIPRVRKSAPKGSAKSGAGVAKPVTSENPVDTAHAEILEHWGLDADGASLHEKVKPASNVEASLQSPPETIAPKEKSMAPAREEIEPQSSAAKAKRVRPAPEPENPPEPVATLPVSDPSFKKVNYERARAALLKKEKDEQHTSTDPEDSEEMSAPSRKKRPKVTEPQAPINLPIQTGVPMPNPALDAWKDKYTASPSAQEERIAELLQFGGTREEAAAYLEGVESERIERDNPKGQMEGLMALGATVEQSQNIVNEGKRKEAERFAKAGQALKSVEIPADSPVVPAAPISPEAYRVSYAQVSEEMSNLYKSSRWFGLRRSDGKEKLASIKHIAVGEFLASGVKQKSPITESAELLTAEELGRTRTYLEVQKKILNQPDLDTLSLEDFMKRIAELRA